MSTEPNPTREIPRLFNASSIRRASRRGLLGLALLGAVALLMLASPTAFAAPTTEAEPNDNLFQAQPVLSAEGVSGRLVSGDDVDEFLLRLRPQRQIKITFALGPGSSVYCDLHAELRDPALPGYLAFLHTDGDGDEPVGQSLVTTPGTFGGASTVMLLKVNSSGFGSPGCNYDVGVSAAVGGQTDAIDTAAFPTISPVPLAEPNDTVAQALGPMSVDATYEGVIETRDDKDYLRVPLKPGTKASVTVSAVGGWTVVTALNSKNERLDYLQADPDEAKTLTFGAPGDEPVFFEMSGETGARWRLRLLPGAVIPAPARPLLGPVKAAPSLVRVRGRRLVVRLRLSQAGKLRLVLRGHGRRIEVGRLRVKGPRTVTLSYRRPAGVRPGRYRLDVIFQATGHRPATVYRPVVFR